MTYHPRCDDMVYLFTLLWLIGTLCMKQQKKNHLIYFFKISTDFHSLQKRHSIPVEHADVVECTGVVLFLSSAREVAAPNIRTAQLM